MSAAKLDKLMQLWAATLPSGQPPPFAGYNDLYNSIDSIQAREIRWQCLMGTYQGACPEGEVPAWMEAEYPVWFRCPCETIHHQIANPDFAGEMDYAPKHVFDKDGKREYGDFMSGNWAWQQAVSARHALYFCKVAYVALL